MSRPHYHNAAATLDGPEYHSNDDIFAFVYHLARGHNNDATPKPDHDDHITSTLHDATAVYDTDEHPINDDIRDFVASTGYVRTDIEPSGPRMDYGWTGCGSP